MTGGALLWAPRAWIGGRWADAVLLHAGADGHWADIDAGSAPPPQATVLPGPVLPGLVDAHSHAFQRAFAGLAERCSSEHDDFWSWRDRMYSVAARITPAQLRVVAAQLYAELLCGGYTQVCEFHYLHHDPGGVPYADALATSRALADAAAGAGIGLTLLPVLYERAGFAQAQLRPDQRRFATDVSTVLALRDGVRAWRQPRVDAGVAIHSLRAAAPASMRTLVQRLEGDAGPIHIHVAEQTAEVEDCLAATGARPIEWLARELPLDARWQLVHATHALPAEIDAVAASGAGVVLCPSTEANLGDGVADLPRWLAGGVPLTLGSDSNVCRSWAEELRWLDYGQRLLHRQRNVAALPSLHDGATAARLFDRALAGGAAAAGLPAWGLVRGARADLLVLDRHAPGLLGVPASHALDALVFATGAPALREVWVAGRRVVADGAHAVQAALARDFSAAMAELWPAQAS
ncbi:MAG: formimidoylglutamate deiminase [Rubrivivax sp.]|nr:formimidoylglutamate deiminase [Rubrivivax sp.]